MSTGLAIIIGWLAGILIAALVIYLITQTKKQPNTYDDLSVYREAGKLASERLKEHLKDDNHE